MLSLYVAAFAPAWRDRVEARRFLRSSGILAALALVALRWRTADPETLLALDLIMGDVGSAADAAASEAGGRLVDWLLPPGYRRRWCRLRHLDRGRRMPIEVVVTADHIASGVPGDAENCAICQALKAAGCTDVGVMSDFDVRYTFGNVPMYETLPPAVVLIAKQIDNRERVGPFSFALPIPIPSTRG